MGYLDMIEEIMVPVHGLENKRLNGHECVCLLPRLFLFVILQEPACRVS